MLLVAGCGDEIDPAWQLDHDRVIAVRATPPRIAVGEAAEIDALLGRVEQPPLEVVPATVTVISPTALVGALAQQAGRWTVTAPDDVRLADARTELGLAADAAVPLRLRVTFNELDKVGLKIVWLGEHTDNPVLGPILVDGVDVSGAAELAVPGNVDVPVVVDFDDRYVVNWLTSCGQMHDFDLPRAYLRVEPQDPQSGSFAVVVRDELGGVTWRVWQITAE